MSANWEWKEHFIFLNILQESGVTNMFGASPYLVEHCDLDGANPREVLINWMDNYQEIQKELTKE
tara:strand:- start:153 stop:347 length:195 start_codon:yes stop_codon:yes gene_type:complete